MSPDLTRCPPAAQIETVAGVWTLNGTVVLLNGNDTGGRGTVLELRGGMLFVLGTDNPPSWFTSSVRADGSVQFTDTGVTDPTGPPGLVYSYSRKLSTNADGSTTEIVGIGDAALQAIVAANVAAWLAVPAATLDALIAQNLQGMGRASVADLDAGYGKAAAAYMRALDKYDGTPAPFGKPVYLAPGDGKKTPAADGAVIELQSNGSIYRNGVRMMVGTKPTNASAGMVYGNGVFMKGATDAAWYQISGATFSKVVGGDASIFT
jgi:hypothetical protein